MRSFGNDSLEILVDFYGTEKKSNGEIFPAVIDAKRCRSQWSGLKQLMRFKRFKCFTDLVNHLIRSSNAEWLALHDEVVKLVKIFKPYVDSSFENEESFSHLKDVVTYKRTSLDAQVESLVKLSHEAHRRYGDSAQKVVDLLPSVKPYLEKKKNVHNAQAAKRMAARRESKKGADQQLDESKKPKKLVQRTLSGIILSSVSVSASSSSSSSSKSSSGSGQLSSSSFSSSSSSSSSSAQPMSDDEPLSESDQEYATSIRSKVTWCQRPPV